MTAEERDTGLAQLVEAALKHGADDVALESVFGKARNRQRRERPASHRVDIADRISGGNLAVDVRVVDDWREEVDGLDQGRAAVPPVHTRIVRGPEIDEDPVVSMCTDGAQHLTSMILRVWRPRPSSPRSVWT